MADQNMGFLNAGGYLGRHNQTGIDPLLQTTAVSTGKPDGIGADIGSGLKSFKNVGTGA